MYVDSQLVRWLRPHQREGVHFLFDCVMGLRLEGKQGEAWGTPKRHGYGTFRTLSQYAGISPLGPLTPTHSQPNKSFF